MFLAAQKKVPKSKRFTHIVVGAGTAGCLLANRLSQQGKCSVLLVEAGSTGWFDPSLYVPAGYLRTIGNPKTDWMFHTEAEKGLNGRAIRYPRGKGLGGCSSINAMLYVRGQSADYDHWATVTGDDAWRWDKCLPYFIKHENHWSLDPGRAGGDPALHGHGGELRVEKMRWRWEVLERFVAAATAHGIPDAPDFNRGNNNGIGYFEVTQRNGVRCNASRAFLWPRLKDGSALEVVTEAQCTRLLFDEASPTKCTGVELRLADGSVEQVFAEKEVVLSAGAVATPQLLQLSGIGPEDLLRRHGIACRVASEGVGRNLQDHLQLRLIFRVKPTEAHTLNTIVQSPIGCAKIGLQYLVNRRGPLAMAPSQLGAFTFSSPDPKRRSGSLHDAQPNIEFHIQPLSLNAFGEPLHKFDAMTVSVCNVHPTSRGSIEITSPDPRDAPRIAPNYLSTRDDKIVAADCIRVARAIQQQYPMSKTVESELRPGDFGDLGDERLAADAGDVGTTIFHPVGTCAMGRAGVNASVVSPRLKVHGVDGLRVVDASVMPTITGGNTNAPVYMIAEKAAEWIAADAR